jgi:Undecaprenyl-phosphate glucose phosphotransferase
MTVDDGPVLSPASPELGQDPEVSWFSAARLRLPDAIAGLICAEFLVVGCAAFLFGKAQQNSVSARVFAERDVLVALMIAALIVCWSGAHHQYRGIQDLSRHQYLLSGLASVALGYSFFLSLLFLFESLEGYSPGTVIWQLSGVAVTLGIERVAAHRLVHSALASGRIAARRVLVIGNVDRIRHLMQDLAASKFDFVGQFPIASLSEDDADLSRRSVSEAAVLEACRSLRPDDVFIVAELSELSRLSKRIELLSMLPLSVHIVPADAGELFSSTRFSQMGKIATVQVARPPLTRGDYALKRGLDVCLAAIGLLVLVPAFIGIAVAIKLSSKGPVFFRQLRYGYNNHLISVLKFRTMYVCENGRHFKQATRDDPRITPLGRILRATNLDELPQLMNVLLGDMSLVGPRPHAVALNEKFESDIWLLSRRTKIKPGMTGWAQVNGYRGETDTMEKMQKRIEYDLYYIENWSFSFDVAIILMTLFSPKAYTNAT